MPTPAQIEAAYNELRENDVYVNHDEVARALLAAEAAAWRPIDDVVDPIQDLIERLEAPHLSVLRELRLEAAAELKAHAARIRELEAELAKAHSALGQIIQDDHRNLVIATKAERDAIRAKTFQECAKVAQQFGRRPAWKDNAIAINCGNMIADAILAFAQSPKDDNKC